MTREYAVAAWLESQMRLAEAARTSHAVSVTTREGVFDRCTVERAARGMVTLRRGREVWTLWLSDVESVVWVTQ